MNIVERRRPQDGQIAIDGRRPRRSTSASRRPPTICGEKVVLRLLDKSRSLLRARRPRHAAPTRTSAFYAARPLAVRHGDLRRPDRERQDHDALRDAHRDQQRRAQRHDDRGPGRVRVPVDQPDPDQRAGRHHLRQRAAVDPAPGPRRRSSSARSATSRPRASPCSPRSPATSCCRRCTPPTRPSALHRFLDMGIESFLIASSVLGVVGQRLVRRICAARAGRRTSPTAEELAFYERVGGTPTRPTFFHGRGLQLLRATPATTTASASTSCCAVTDEIKQLDRRRTHRTTRSATLADRAGHAHARGRGRAGSSSTTSPRSPRSSAPSTCSNELGADEHAHVQVRRRRTRRHQGQGRRRGAERGRAPQRAARCATSRS